MLDQPKHIGIILDGNGRWATQRGKKRTEGHAQGVETVLDIARAAADRGITTLSLYAFSTENWKRPADEVSTLMRLLHSFLDRYLNELMERRVRLRIMGDPSRLPAANRLAIRHALSLTEKNDGLILNIGLNYGGRDEIVRALRHLSRKGTNLEQLTEEQLESALDTAGLPPLDLLIRTGGERRVSNFMLWQIAYTELYFTDTLWPDFSAEELDQALAWYRSQDRRFGGLT